jgi:hypothetical protein
MHYLQLGRAPAADVSAGAEFSSALLQRAALA